MIKPQHPNGIQQPSLCLFLFLVNKRLNHFFTLIILEKLLRSAFIIFDYEGTPSLWKLKLEGKIILSH